MSKGYTDYFNPQDVEYTYTFPDKMSSLTFRRLKEADRAWARNQRSIVKMNQETKIMELDARNGTFKTEIISRALVGWDIQTKKEDSFERVPFETRNVAKLLDNLDPDVIDQIYEVVESNNAWLRDSGVSSGSLRKQAENLMKKAEEQEVEEKK